MGSYLLYLVLIVLSFSCGDNRGDKSLLIELPDLYQCTGSFNLFDQDYSLYFEDDSQERWLVCAQNVAPHQRGVEYRQPIVEKRYDEVSEGIFRCRLSLYGVPEGQLFADVGYTRDTGVVSYEITNQESERLSDGNFICKVRL